MDKETERKSRMKRTGHWFAPAHKDKTLWLNYIFPIVLVISLICLILVRN